MKASLIVSAIILLVAVVLYIMMGGNQSVGTGVQSSSHSDDAFRNLKIQ